MDDFDAELYLRAVGEKQQAADGPLGGAFAGRLDYAAAALVAVGAIRVDDARAVLADFGWEERDDHIAQHLEPCRVVALNAEVRLPSGILRLSHARLGENETAIVASYRVDADKARVHHDWIRVPSGWPSGLQPLTLADDAGGKTTVSFHGWGNDDRWQATLRAEAPIAPSTAWIELGPKRVRCIDDRPELRIALEPVQSRNPAHSHLWRYLSRCDPFFDSFVLDAAVDALLASGHLKAGDPVLQQYARVRSKLANPNSPRTAPRGFRALPEPWSSVIRRRGKTDGPTGLVLLAAEVPMFSGHRVAIDALESFPDRFVLAARQTPTPLPTVRFRGSVLDQEVVWWARDDRRNHYLANWESDELRFSTSLDPLATKLELIPTAIDSRAVISFPLQWIPPST